MLPTSQDPRFTEPRETTIFANLQYSPSIFDFVYFDRNSHNSSFLLHLLLPLDETKLLKL